MLRIQLDKSGHRGTPLVHCIWKQKHAHLYDCAFFRLPYCRQNHLRDASEWPRKRPFLASSGFCRTYDSSRETAQALDHPSRRLLKCRRIGWLYRDDLLLRTPTAKAGHCPVGRTLPVEGKARPPGCRSNAQSPYGSGPRVAHGRLDTFRIAGGSSQCVCRRQRRMLASNRGMRGFSTTRLPFRRPVQPACVMCRASPDPCRSHLLSKEFQTIWMEVGPR